MSIPDLAIREIRARPVVAPLPRPIKTASGDVLDAPLLLIDVLTNAGVTRRAYAFAYTPLTLRSLAQFLGDIAPELVGKSVSPRARMRQLVLVMCDAHALAIHFSAGSPQSSARAWEVAVEESVGSADFGSQQRARCNAERRKVRRRSTKWSASVIHGNAS
jgi:hypothetical protein